MNTINQLAQEAALSFSLAESKSNDAIQCAVQALGMPSDTEAPSYTLYQEYRAAFMLAYYNDTSDVEVDSLDSIKDKKAADRVRKAFSRHYAAAGFSKVPEMPTDLKKAESAVKADKRKAAKEEADKLAAKYKTTEAMRKAAAESIAKGNTATAMLLSKAAEVKEKEAATATKRTLLQDKARLIELIRQCEDRAVLGKCFAAFAIKEPKAKAA